MISGTTSLNQDPSSGDLTRRLLAMLFALFLLSCHTSTPQELMAQTEAQLNVADGDDEIASGGYAPVTEPAEGETESKFNLFGLLLKGGVLMVPICLMSVLVIALVIERFLNL